MFDVRETASSLCRDIQAVNASTDNYTPQAAQSPSPWRTDDLMRLSPRPTILFDAGSRNRAVAAPARSRYVEASRGRSSAG